MKLPELPIAALQHSRLVTKDGVFGALYTPEQIELYGRQCAEAMRDECAALVMSNATACVDGSIQQMYLASNGGAIRKLEVE